jgi:hypothetical protein
VSVSAHSAGAYTVALDVMVTRVKRGGRAPPPLNKANFSIMMECTPESGSCHSVCTLWFFAGLYTGQDSILFLPCLSDSLYSVERILRSVT